MENLTEALTKCQDRAWLVRKADRNLSRYVSYFLCELGHSKNRDSAIQYSCLILHCNAGKMLSTVLGRWRCPINVSFCYGCIRRKGPASVGMRRDLIQRIRCFQNSMSYGNKDRGTSLVLRLATEGRWTKKWQERQGAPAAAALRPGPRQRLADPTPARSPVSARWFRAAVSSGFLPLLKSCGGGSHRWSLV